VTMAWFFGSQCDHGPGAERGCRYMHAELLVSQHLEKVRLKLAKLLSSVVILLPLGRMQLDHACLCNLELVTLTSVSRSSLDTPPLSYSERTRHD
jgi:hypothetical protein